MDQCCVLCQQTDESVHRLFFICSYSADIWRRVLDLMKYNRALSDMTEELANAIKMAKKKSAASRLL